MNEFDYWLEAAPVADLKLTPDGEFVHWLDGAPVVDLYVPSTAGTRRRVSEY